MKCVLCEEVINVEQDQRGYAYYGHNARPVADGRCCDFCNYAVVIPARIQALRKAREESQ